MRSTNVLWEAKPWLGKTTGMTTHALAPALSDPEHAWLDTTAYPFALRRWSCPEGSLAYVDEGSGPPVLFVHGTPSWSFEFRHVISALRGERRCVAIDHLGFGLSDKPVHAAYRPEDHAQRLADLVRALDLRELTLVVHDFGGPIGMPLALEMPERVSRIVVLNSFMWPNGDDPAVRKADRVIRSFVGRFLYRWLSFSPRVLLPAVMADRKALSPATHAQYLKPFARRQARESLYAMACALSGSDPFYATLWARRGELRARVTDIVWGEKDPAFTERHLARWLEAFPSARLTRVPTAGHFVAEEAPGALIDALR
jgi:haloalkane dehalogenase